ncbi:MAG: hypothetical protein ACRC62_27400 [Microcoleus sp.]
MNPIAYHRLAEAVTPTAQTQKRHLGHKDITVIESDRARDSRTGGQKPGFWRKYFVAADILVKNPVSLVQMCLGRVKQLQHL